MISVIIPTYNGESVLCRAVDSVQNQNMDVEIIVVDDCSIDSTYEIACDMGCTVLSTLSHSGGPNRGRNIGLDVASGDYICFLDQDDEFLPGKLEYQLELTDYSDIVFADFILNNTRINKTTLYSKNNNIVDNYAENYTFLRCLAKDKRHYRVPALNSLLISNTLKDIRFEEHFGCVDYDYMLRLLEYKTTVKFNVPLTRRNTANDNLSLMPYYRLVDYYYSLLVLESYKEKYPREVRCARYRLNGTRARYHYLTGQMKESRYFLRRSDFSVKTMLYYLTSFGVAGKVRQKFQVIGS